MRGDREALARVFRPSDPHARYSEECSDLVFRDSKFQPGDARVIVDAHFDDRLIHHLVWPCRKFSHRAHNSPGEQNNIDNPCASCEAL